MTEVTLLPEMVRGGLRPLRERIAAGDSGPSVALGAGMVGAMIAEMAGQPSGPSRESFLEDLQVIEESLGLLREAREHLAKARVAPESMARMDDILARAVGVQQRYLHAAWRSRGESNNEKVFAAIAAAEADPNRKYASSEEFLQIISEGD